MKTKYLLICGILSTILYISADIILGLISPGYSFNSQAISELSAIGAPTRSYWIAMTFLYSPLLIAFGIGVKQIAKKNRSLRITGILLSLWGILGFVWLLFPMHLRGYIGSTTDTMHLVMSGITVVLILSFLGIGSATQGKRFRFYTFLTILIMLIFGALVGKFAPLVAANLPTPWMGIMERITVYSPMIWVVVLAVILLRLKKKH